MADRAKTLLGLMPAVSSIVASSTYDANYPASKTNDKLVDNTTGVIAGFAWVTAIGPAYPVTLRFDFGSAKAFDSCLIAGTFPTYEYYCPRNGGIEYSSDDTNWFSPGGGSEFTDLFGGSAPASSRQFAALSWTRTTARYWRIRIDSHYAGVNDITGIEEWILWDSTLIGARLDNVPPTITAPGATTADATKMSNRTYIETAYGLYYVLANNAAGVFELDLGSTQYLGGLDILCHDNSVFSAKSFDLFTSTNGTTWTWVEKVTCPANVVSQLQSIPFSRIYSSRYFRFNIVANTSGFLWQEWFLYATLTPAAPANPTSVTARASDTGTDIEVTWSEAAGDDNALADLVYKVERQKDGAGWTTLTSTHPVTHYVDASLAAGDYDYRVTAINSYHARESSAVQTSASVTSPAAAGGGAARSVFAGAGMRVS